MVTFPFERANIGIGGGQIQNPTTLQAVSDLNAARNLYAPGHLTNKLLGYLQEGVVWANGLGNNISDPMGGGGLSSGASTSGAIPGGFDSSLSGLGSGLGGGLGSGLSGVGDIPGNGLGGISPQNIMTNLLIGLLSMVSPFPIINTGFSGGPPSQVGGLDNFSSGGFIPLLSKSDPGGLNPQPLDQPAAVEARRIIFGQVKPGTELRDPTAQGRLTQLRQLLLGFPQ